MRSRLSIFEYEKVNGVLTKREFVELWQKQILDGENILHLETENPDFDLLEKRDNLGATPLHYFCATATGEQLKLAFGKIPFKYWEVNDKTSRNFFHYVAQAGNRNAIEYILSEKLPEQFKVFLLEKNMRDSNFFNFVALSGNKE